MSNLSDFLTTENADRVSMKRGRHFLPRFVKTRIAIGPQLC